VREVTGDRSPRGIWTDSLRKTGPLDEVGFPTGPSGRREGGGLGRVFGYIALVVLIAGVLGSIAISKFRKSWGQKIDLGRISLRQITDHGRAATFAAISPDGRLVAYAKREANRSLRVKQVATGSEVIVVPEQTGFYDGTTFTPDGNYLYYLHTDPKNENLENVYVVPSMGGSSRLVVADVYSPISFSRDGKRMVYLRWILENKTAQLLMANADGTQEKILYQGNENAYLACPTWSPGNNRIVVISSGLEKNAELLVLTEDGKVEMKLRPPTHASAVAWLPDGSGLFVLGFSALSNPVSQIWFQPYPEGERVKVSNDLDNYSSVSVTGDGQSLVTSKWRSATTIYEGNSPAVMNDRIQWDLKPISSERTAGSGGLAWTSNGRLLQLDGAFHLYSTAADGSGRVQLGGAEAILEAAPCGGADDVVTVRMSGDLTKDVWKMNATTGESRQLTSAENVGSISCTPDGNWIVYVDWTNTAINKISANGGIPTQLVRGNVSDPVMSPDGKFLAYGETAGQGANQKFSLVVRDLESGASLKKFEMAPNFGNANGRLLLGWTPDGHALSFLNTVGNAQHLMMQPLTGGVPVQLTHFDTEPSMIVAYAWSKDGKKVALSRDRYNGRDIVMFSGFR